jgi:hypothetical protein
MEARRPMQEAAFAAAGVDQMKLAEHTMKYVLQSCPIPDSPPMFLFLLTRIRMCHLAICITDRRVLRRSRRTLDKVLPDRQKPTQSEPKL